MAEEASLRDEVRAKMGDSGFDLVQFEAPLDPSSKARPDVVAWAADSNEVFSPHSLTGR